MAMKKLMTLALTITMLSLAPVSAMDEPAQSPAGQSSPIIKQEKLNEQLRRAVKAGATAVVAGFLERNADPLARDSNNLSALDLALASKNKNIIRLIESHIRQGMSILPADVQREIIKNVIYDEINQLINRARNPILALQRTKKYLPEYFDVIV